MILAEMSTETVNLLYAVVPLVLAYLAQRFGLIPAPKAPTPPAPSLPAPIPGVPTVPPGTPNIKTGNPTLDLLLPILLPLISPLLLKEINTFFEKWWNSVPEEPK